MKRTLIVCLGLALIAGLLYAETADRAPAAGARIDMKKEADLTAGTPMAGKAAGGPDAYGFRYIDSDEAGGPTFNWIDITGTGTALNLTDDSEATITSSFPITFYGVSSTNFRVGNNGAVLFDTTAGDVTFSNYALPSVNYGRKSFLPFQDDIDSDIGNVYWQELGVAPNRMLVIEWFDRPHYSNTGAVTFEMVLYEGKEEVLFQYLDTDFGNPSYNYGISATVGIQGDPQAATNWFLQYSYLTASLHDNLAIKFFTYVPQAGDLALQSIDEPSAAFIEPGLPLSPMATVGNPGTTAVSNFQAVFSIDDGTTKALVYEDTVDIAGPLDPGATVQATFDDFTPLDMSNYYVTAYVSAAGDPYADNDTIHFYFRTFNELVGNVTDDNNGGAPVDAATITAVGPATYSTTTDGSGDYFFFDMAAGTYTVTASKTGYLNEVVSGVTITDGAQTTLDLSMGYPVLALTPSDSVYVSLPWGLADSTTWQFTLENQGSRDMTYSVSWPELTKGTRAFRDSLYGLNVEPATGNNLNLGVEFTNGYIWVTSAGASSSSGDNYLTKIDPVTGSMVNNYIQPAASSSGWGWRDLAFDGTYLYASYSGVIDQINPATGAVTGTTIPSPQNPGRALAYNPSNDHFYVANFASSIYEITRAGAAVNTWANAKSIYGLAYDGDNPAGPSLWVWSQDGTPSCQATRFDLTTGVYGTETFQAFGTTAVAGGATLTNDLVPGKTVLLGMYQETPDRLVGHEIRDNSVAWLDITPNSGTVSAYGTENLAVAFDAAGLDSFTDWAANVTFNTNAQLAKANAYVPAYMHVLGLTGVGGGPTTPLSYAFGLNANRPNPVNGRTSFSFTLPKAQDYALKIYNIAGQMVASFSGKGQAGPNSVAWNTGKNGAGVYFYQLASGGMSATRKLVVVK